MRQSSVSFSGLQFKFKSCELAKNLTRKLNRNGENVLVQRIGRDVFFISEKQELKLLSIAKKTGKGEFIKQIKKLAHQIIDYTKLDSSNKLIIH